MTELDFRIITQTRQMIIIKPHWAILTISWLLLVQHQSVTILLKHLTLNRIHGRCKVNFRIVQLSEFMEFEQTGLIFLRISRFAVINFPSFFFVLGGYCDGTSSSRIAKFETNTWAEVGNLKQARFGHRSIAANDRVYVVGGYNAYLYVFV